MRAKEAVFSPRETRVVVWVMMGALALTAAGLAARDTMIPPTIERAERASLSHVPEAQPLVPTEAFL